MEYGMFLDLLNPTLASIFRQEPSEPKYANFYPLHILNFFSSPIGCCSLDSLFGSVHLVFDKTVIRELVQIFVILRENSP